MERKNALVASVFNHEVETYGIRDAKRGNNGRLPKGARSMPTKGGCGNDETNDKQNTFIRDKPDYDHGAARRLRRQ
ncbi:hypothetical protein [Paenibacillus sp. PL91]|uniref:hypothetical protein n=1 Tax=Paenibacillus sp. PL91 TaxID=2729538 RepID=UPI00145EF975|nr:hypothetical protein [Paenibacillus sp. PL91]MBC9200734.1 hypothetical protein [Paenibacillus sp. PL91]